MDRQINSDEAQRPRRVKKPLLIELEDNYDKAVFELEQVLKIEIADLDGDQRALKDHSRRLKQHGADFLTSSRELSKRYNSVGSVRESQQVRNLRNEVNQDIAESIKSINVLLTKLGLNETSNFDCSSERSGYSLQSQLDNFDNLCVISAIASPPPPEQFQDVPIPTPSLYQNRQTVIPPETQNEKVPPKIYKSNLYELHREPFPLPHSYQAGSLVTNDEPFSSYKYDQLIPPQHFVPKSSSQFRPIPTSDDITYHSSHPVKNVDPINFQKDPPDYLPLYRPKEPLQSTDTQFKAFHPAKSFQSYSNPKYRSEPISHECMSSVGILSKHILQQDLIKKSIEPFDGTAFNFWPWIGKLRNYITDLELSPLQTLQLLESNCVGDPQKMISRTLASTGEVSSDIVNRVYDRLIQRFGSSQRIAAELFKKIEAFPVVQGINIGAQLEDLHDLCRVIEYNQSRCTELKVLDLASGLQIIRSKLPDFIQLQWRQYGQTFEDAHDNLHPPFTVFVNFLEKTARQQNNINYEIIHNKKDSSNVYRRVLHTDMSNPNNSSSSKANSLVSSEYCYLHKSDSHSIHDCKAFYNLTYSEKKKVAFDNKLCFLCLKNHFASSCVTDIKCKECNRKHDTLMHNFEISFSNKSPHQPHVENRNSESNTNRVMLSHVLNSELNSKNCSKTLLVELTMKGETKSLLCLCIIDEQSTVTLVDDRVVQYFGKSFPTQEYSLKFACDNYEISNRGHLVSGLEVRGMLEEDKISLPTALSCPNIADTSDEVAFPSDLQYIKQLSKYAELFPNPIKDAEVLLLIGRDCGLAMASQYITDCEPYLVKTPLGYSVIGQLYPDKPRSSEQQSSMRVMRTSSLYCNNITAKFMFPPKRGVIDINNPFQRCPDDELLGLSQDDKIFLHKMNNEVCTTSTGNLQLPLPIRDTAIPSNKAAVYLRTKNTLRKLSKEPSKLTDCIEQMKNNLQAGFVEKIPQDELTSLNKTWYLPIFCITHPKKNKVRLVYDASARYDGISLNDLLYQGPDLNNHLRGVLFRFREKPVAVSADIQTMFSNFKIPPKQWDMLRFFWFDKNDPTQDLCAYRSTSHIFGCSSSPAVASFALKFLSHINVEEQFKSAQPYLQTSFYVDDFLCSSDSVEEATNILSSSITMLKNYNMRLHKITSNSRALLQSFPPSEVSEPNIRLSFDKPTHQHTLGVARDVDSDSFVMEVKLPQRKFTKRGILSLVSSIYDPVSFISPVVLTGRLIQRSILPPKELKDSRLADFQWDDQLPDEYRPRWETWLSTLTLLNNVKIPRSFYPDSFRPIRQELHVFCDASVEAIGHVMYMRSINVHKEVHVSFVTGSSKVSPRCATTVPRLELCAAMEAAKSTTALISELKTKPDELFMYTDSCIVLGYLTNTGKRFTKYVERRVDIILNHVPQEKWSYVSTHINPADIATRPHTPSELLATCWFTGPACLWDDNYTPSESPNINITSMSLPEIKIVKTVLHTHKELYESPLSCIYSKNNNFSKIINVVIYVKRFIKALRRSSHSECNNDSEIFEKRKAIVTIVKEAQKEKYGSLIKSLKSKQPIPENLKLTELSPYLDNDGVMCVGGRLKNANIPFCVKHPLLIPSNHPLSTAIINYFHARCKHQGSHISHGIIIQSGFHLENGRQLIRQVIKNCIICKKLRATTSVQLMADLPYDRLEEVPPFTNVGIDIFGPFLIHDGKNTRRTLATKKIWVLIIVCLPSRAIHLEPLVGMDTSSFRNALTRFITMRGNCQIIRSDQGSNFLCARKQMDAIDVRGLAKELQERNIQWILNPPQASHHAGSWERKIGSVRRVLEGTLAVMNNRGLSRDEFATIIAEAASIVNQTPLWTVPNDPNDPAPLTPAMLLTLKSNPGKLCHEDITEKDVYEYGQRRYRRINYLSGQFWSRWRQEYLQNLTRRHKWKKVSPCISVDDVVLVRDKSTKRNQWPLGRVTELRLSDDGLVRSVTLQIAPLANSKTPRLITRAITDLVLLIPSSAHKC